jgi:hypothetical protein
MACGEQLLHGVRERRSASGPYPEVKISFFAVAGARGNATRLDSYLQIFVGHIRCINSDTNRDD